jgi:hypothetical protein
MRSRPKLTAVIAICLLVLIILGFNFLPQVYRSIRFAYLTRNVELAIQKEPTALEIALTNGQAYTLQRDINTGFITGSSCNGSIPVYGVLHTWSNGLHLIIEEQHYHFDQNGRWTATNNLALTAQGNWVAGCDPSTALEIEPEPELTPESEPDNPTPQFSGSIKLNRSLFNGYNITSVYTDDSVTGDFCYNDFTTPYFDPRTRPNIYIYIQGGPVELNGLYLITFVKWIHFNETGIVEEGSTNYFSDSDC